MLEAPLAAGKAGDWRSFVENGTALKGEEIVVKTWKALFMGGVP